MHDSLADLRQELLALLCRDAYRAGEFILSSGQKSHYYINCKPVTLSARGAYLVGRLFLAQLAPEAVAVAGLTLGADPLVVAVSVLSNVHGQDRAALIVRKEAKGHGTMSFIEGPPLPQGAVVTVLEDVITTGGLPSRRCCGSKRQAMWSMRFWPLSIAKRAGKLPLPLKEYPCDRSFGLATSKPTSMRSKFPTAGKFPRGT